MAKDLKDLLAQAQKIMSEYSAPSIYFGDGCIIESLKSSLYSKKSEKIFICSGGKNSFSKSGAEQKLKEALKNFKCSFSAPVPAEPDTEYLKLLTKDILENNPDTVIAVGGGSALDAAKAAYLCSQTRMSAEIFFGANKVKTAYPGVLKKIIAIPTTSGTGSEATRYSNIIDSTSGVKLLISDSEIRPALAFVDPELTFSMPRDLSITVALDALAHAVESVLNWKSAEQHPEIANIGLIAIKLIVNGLPKVLQNGSAEGRTMLSAAAALAGICIDNCPTSLPHLCSFSFYKKSSHGRAVAALLPHFWRYYLQNENARRRTMIIAEAFGAKTPEETVALCENFISESEAEIRIGKVAGEDASFIEKLAADALKNPIKLKTAPCDITEENCLEIFKAALEPGW